MKSALMQQINTYISIIFVGTFALGASYLIIHTANKVDYGLASSLISEEVEP